MNITTIILFLVFIIPIILGVFSSRKSKKLAYIFFSIPFIFMLVAAGLWAYEVNHRFVSNTDLETESLGNISLNETINENFIQNHGEFEESENIKYDQFLVFDTFSIGTNANSEIIYMITDQKSMLTQQGTRVGDSIDDVIQTYGEKHYKSGEMGQGKTINYIDRKAKVHLQFWYEDDRVERIAIYAM